MIESVEEAKRGGAEESLEEGVTYAFFNSCRRVFFFLREFLCKNVSLT